MYAKMQLFFFFLESCRWGYLKNDHIFSMSHASLALAQWSLKSTSYRMKGHSGHCWAMFSAMQCNGNSLWGFCLFAAIWGNRNILCWEKNCMDNNQMLWRWIKCSIKWIMLLCKYKFSQSFYFHEFRELNLKRENKNWRNIFPSFINERKVCTTNDTQV